MVDIVEFIDVKGWKVLGNKLIDKKIFSFKDLIEKFKKFVEFDEKLFVGDMIDFEVGGNG